MKRLLILLAFIFVAGTVARAQVSSSFTLGTRLQGATLPVSCTDKRRLFTLTATDGANAPGLYRCNGSAYVGVTGGTGDVAGPASATDNAIPRFHLTTGKIIQNSLATIDDPGSINIPAGQAYKINNVAMAKGDVGLGNVDDTSDAAKPVSTAQQTALDLKQNALGFTAENSANKDATGGYAGLTLFKLNFKNAANTFTSFFTNANTAARTYTYQDRDGTIADDTDLAGKQASGNYITALTGDGTASGPGSVGLTLATVNGNIGTFGSGTQSLTITANAKGLITGVSAQTVTPAWGSITSTPTTLAGYGITDAQPLDTDLTTIAGLVATSDNFIVSVADAWASRTPAQVKTTLSLNNVDNTSDAGKPVSTAQQTALDLKQNTITFGTDVQTALGVNIGSAGAPVLFNGAGGTPTSLVGTNISGTAASLTAGSATILQTARNINGVSFNGSTDITVTAAAGTLSGATLASGVTASSLTSFGNSPTLVTPSFTTSITGPLMAGGTANGATITIQGSSGAAPAASYVVVNPQTVAGTTPAGVFIGAPTSETVDTASVSDLLHMQGSDAKNALLVMDTYGTGLPAIWGRSAAGTAAARTATPANQILLLLGGLGYQTTTGAFTAAPKAQIRLQAAEAFTSTAQGTYIAFLTTLIGSTPLTERLRILDNGNLDLASAAWIGAGTPAIAGNGTLNTGSKDSMGKVTSTGTGGSTVVLTFSTPFARAPACTAMNETTANLIRATSTTTTLTINATVVSGDSLSYICLGY